MQRLSGYYVFFIICGAALTTRAVLDSSFRNSTLLYLLIPFGISIALHLAIPISEDESVAGRYGRHMRAATIVMLASSALLFEGFLCVLFFMPIYYLVVSLGFLFGWLADRHDGDGHAGAYAIPLLVAVLAAEGLTGATTVPRYNEATYTQIVPGSIAALQANMARPVRFEAKRHWFLWLFPMPTRVQAASLKPGDVHRLHFVYKRWFFANIQQGDMAIRIAEVGPARIRTQIVENESYLSHYMKIDGTEVRFRDAGGGRTLVSLTVKYHRLLDPAWYFGPMEQFAARQSARYLIDTIIARKDG